MLPQGAVTIQSPADNLVTGHCYTVRPSPPLAQPIHPWLTSGAVFAQEFSVDLSSLHITAPSGEPLTSIALSTKYTSLGQCAPAIAGLGWVQSTDYDTQDCTKPAPPPAPAQGGAPAAAPGKGDKGHRGGAGGDASNRIAVQFDICCERKPRCLHARSSARPSDLVPAAVPLIPPSPLAAQTWTRTSRTWSTTRPRPSMRHRSVTTSRCVDRAPPSDLLPLAARRHGPRLPEPCRRPDHALR